MKYMKVQKVHLPQPIPNLGEAMPVPAHVAYIVVPKAEPLRCLALKTRDMMYTVHIVHV